MHDSVDDLGQSASSRLTSVRYFHLNFAYFCLFGSIDVFIVVSKTLNIQKRSEMWYSSSLLISLIHKETL